MTAARPSAEELAREYHVLGSVRAVAAAHGVAFGTASRWFREAQVALGPRSHGPQPGTHPWSGYGKEKGQWRG